MGRWPNYKEDSTRGKAIMAPKTYKGDALVHIWLDRRKLASLSVWLDSNGLTTRFMSDVIRMTLDQVYNMLVESGEVREFDTVAAGDFLSVKYKVDLNPGGRGERNLLHNMQLSERIKEFNARPAEVTMAAESVSNEDEDEVNKKALEHYNKKMEEKRAFEEKLARIKSGEKLDSSKVVESKPIVMEKVKKEVVISHPAESTCEYTMEDLEKAKEVWKKTGDRSRYNEVSLGLKRQSIESKKKDSDAIRSKTTEEINKDFERIAEKDKALANMDMSAPKPTA